VVEFEKHVLGKPENLDQARETLRLLSGKTHQVVTGVSLRCNKTAVRCDFAEVTEVTFKPFGDDVIEEYITKVNTLDKAGAYGIQTHGEMLVESIEGSMNNVIGLPTERLTESLRILT